MTRILSIPRGRAAAVLLPASAHADCALNPNRGTGTFPNDGSSAPGRIGRIHVDFEDLASSIANKDLRVADGATVAGPLDVSNGRSVSIGDRSLIGRVSGSVPAVTLRKMFGTIHFLDGEILASDDAR